MFDRDRRHKAPKWLREQLAVVPPSQQFDCYGKCKGASTEEPVSTGVPSSDDMPDGMEDEEAEGFSQA